MELSADELRALAVDFAAQLTDAEKLPYTLAIHKASGRIPNPARRTTPTRT